MSWQPVEEEVFPFVISNFYNHAKKESKGNRFCKYVIEFKRYYYDL